MAQATKLPDPARLHLLGWSADELAIIAQVMTTTPGGCCPLCQQCSTRVHSCSIRQVADLPWHGMALRLQVRVRRFFCSIPACQRTIFTKRLPGLLAPSARRTTRLMQVWELIGMQVGGEAGACLLAVLGMAASPGTLLRLIRRAFLASAHTPRVRGVEDFASRRGTRCGTILLDLERRRVVDPSRIEPLRCLRAGYACTLGCNSSVEIVAAAMPKAGAWGPRRRPDCRPLPSAQEPGRGA